MTTDRKKFTLTQLEALTGQVADKMGEGEYFDEETGVCFGFERLSDTVIDWLQSKCLDEDSTLNMAMYWRWLTRAAWRWITTPESGAERLYLDLEYVPFNGPTVNGTGRIQMVPWEYIEKMWAASKPLMARLAIHLQLGIVQSPEERARLAFTDGSSPAANSAEVKEPESVTPVVA